MSKLKEFIWSKLFEDEQDFLYHALTSYTSGHRLSPDEAEEVLQTLQDLVVRRRSVKGKSSFIFFVLTYCCQVLGVAKIRQEYPVLWTKLEKDGLFEEPSFLEFREAE